jgi:hypothetical protein
MYSDHAPVLLQLDVTPLYKAYPFKFNSNWLMEQDFEDLVLALWNDQKFLTESNKQNRLVWKLKELKEATKKWKKACLLKEASYLSASRGRN